CWQKHQLGYHVEFNCHAGEASSWGTPKKAWCCSNRQICEGHTGIAFDCNAALGNWEKAWSPAKKTWCWVHEKKGGPGAPPPVPGGGNAWGAAGMLPAGGGFGGDFAPDGGPGYNCASALANW
ncbi:unnamed protein product, partial [Effrenium voratum]